MAKKKKQKTGKKRQHRSGPGTNHATFPLTDDNGKNYSVYEYEITTEPILNPYFEKLPDHAKERVIQFYHEVYRHPLKVIPELLEWIKRYPKLPVLSNYLILAYSNAGEIEKAEEAARECFRCHPDYLFARLNYAEIFLHNEDYKKVEEIFEHKYDLKLLYPKRKTFHLSEVTGFMGVVGLYLVGTGNYQTAEIYYNVIRQLAPAYPITKRLRKKLYPNPFRRLWLRLRGK